MLSPKPITNSLRLSFLRLNWGFVRHKLGFGLLRIPIHLVLMGLLGRGHGEYPGLDFTVLHGMNVTDDGIFGEFLFGGGRNGILARDVRKP
jgi:hypothetical protein